MSRAKVVIEQTGIRVVTVGIQGPPGAGGATYTYVDAGDTASRARANHTGTQTASTISDFASAADARITIQKSIAGGLASLGGDGKVPTGQLPANIVNTVTSVNSKTGVVTVTKSDVGLGSVQNVDSTQRASHTGTQAASTISDFDTAADARITAQKGNADGIASLDATGKVLTSQIPATSDATGSSKGVVQLAGDLGGTAASPTVPGLAAKAPLASPTLTGTPTAPTAAAGTNTTQIATTAFTKTAIDNLVAAAPGALDTLDELATALGDDANFAGTVTTALATKAPLASPALTGTPTAPTPSAGDNSTKISTTAYADAVGTTAAKSRMVTKTIGQTGTEADYICDGTADDVQIQAALNAMTAGGELRIRNASTPYDMTATVLIPSNVTISGEGHTTILKANASLGGLVNMFTNANSSNTNIHITNLAIDGNQTNRTGKTAGADELGQNILLKNCSKSSVTKVHSFNGAQGNIALGTGSTECIISGNWVHNSWNHNILLTGGHFTAIGCDRNIISNNISHNAGDGGTQGVGIEIANYACENVVSGNTSYDNLEGGIHCYQYSMRNNITGNICFNNSQNGIGMVVGCDYNVITSNFIKDSTQAGINCIPNGDLSVKGGQNLTIAGNTIVGCGWNGIRGTTAGDLSNSVIDGNLIDSCGAGGAGNINFGIWLPGVTNLTISNNRIYNSYSSAINAVSPFYLSITGNEITNSGATAAGFSSHAIVLQTTSASADCQVTNNVILFTHGAAILVSYNAVRMNISNNTIRTTSSNTAIGLSGLSYSVVNGNTVTGAGIYGISLSRGAAGLLKESTNNTICGNTVQGCTSGGIVELNISDYNIYVGNQVSGNTTNNMVLIGSHNEFAQNIGY